ncbi:hypothetical protein BV20DRAFT_219135 [Pilatotrama ljubarskyi]|nr:hypothetical protein BV20DRAFT_219135 [Pilatotrama ljubarskyi]
MPGSLDSDLYDDLYGDNEENREETAQQESTQSLVEQKQSTSEAKPEEKPVVAKKESSLPPKPPSSSELSYSAQVAQQFSAYKQTPAQERQQYQVSPSTSGSKANGAGTGDSSQDDASRRAVRPSEMKDEG